MPRGVKKVPTPTKEETKVALEFANGLNNYMSNYYMNGVFTPFTQNQSLLNLNNNQYRPDYERIVKSLSSSLEDSNAIQGYSEYMKVWDTIYSKTLNFYENILSFDLSYVCKNVKNPSEYASEEYKQDYRRVQKFLDNFDYKREFKKAMSQVLRTGVYFCWFRSTYGTITDEPFKDDDIDTNIQRLPKYALQMMPQKYCLLTDYSQETLIWDFDMNFFLNPVNDINLYDPSFKKKFKNVFSGEDWVYNPSAQYDERNGTYTTYTQMSPNDGMWTFKFDESNFNILPPFGNLMKAVFNNTKIQELQLNKDFASAVAILMGELKLYDTTKGSEKQNQFAISPQAVGEFMGFVKDALNEVFKPVALPLENSKLEYYEDKNTTMLADALDSSAGQGASSNSLIYSSGKKGQAEVLNGIITDYNLMRPLYKQFSAFMNFFINKKTKKYKFNFTFDGSIYPFEREYRRKALLEHAMNGMVPNITTWASVYGYDSPQDFERSLQEAKYGGMTDFLMLLPNSNTANMGSQGGKVGNPTKDETQLTDSGQTSREYS